MKTSFKLPPISLVGGGSLLDWANLKKFKYSNDELNKTNDPIAWYLWAIQSQKDGVCLIKIYYLQSFC